MSYNIGGRNYSFDEFLRALDLLDARQNQFGYTVRNPLEMAAMEENLGGQPFSYDPRTGQFVRNPNLTPEQRDTIADRPYSGEGNYGGVGPAGSQSFMYLNRPEGFWTAPTLPGEQSVYMGKGNVPVSTSSSEVQRFLGLPPETQKLIANMTPEEYGRLKLMGGATPGVRDEGLMPPGATGGEGPAPGQTVGEWLKEQRGKQRTYHKPAEISAERQAQLKLAGQTGLESILRAMAGRGLTSLEAVNQLGQKGLLGGTGVDKAYTPFNPAPGTAWQNIVPPTALPKPAVDTTYPTYRPYTQQEIAAWNAYKQSLAALTAWNAPPEPPNSYAPGLGGGGYWLNQATSQYSDLLDERAQQIASERLIPFERAQKLAIKQMRAPTSGAYAGAAMSSTWK
jgi:hypothetical protein